MYTLVILLHIRSQRLDLRRDLDQPQRPDLDQLQHLDQDQLQLKKATIMMVRRNHPDYMILPAVPEDFKIA